MPKRKSVKSTPNKNKKVTRKVENDIALLLQNHKRRSGSTYSEIIISDDSSDFVINDCRSRSNVDTVDLTSQASSNATETIDWVTAAGVLVQDSFNETDNGKCDKATADSACEEEENVLSNSPDLFDWETELYTNTFVLNNCVSTPKTKIDNNTEPLNLQLDIDPFSIFPSSDLTIEKNNTQSVVASDVSRESGDVDDLNGGQDNTSLDLVCSLKSKLKNSESVSHKVPNIVVLDGVKKQSTITSFFGGKTSKPTLTFVEDAPKNGVLKEKTAKLETKFSEKDLEPAEKVFSGSRSCPFYKKIPGTNFVVDAFSYGLIPGVQNYFLSHFHSDHYQGLNKHFRKPIFCTQVTANLVALKLRVYKSYLNVLPLNVPTRVEEVEVTPLEANHCPGAVMFIFHFPKTGQRILHTGDFRFHHTMTSSTLCPPLQNRIHQLFLDTTYLNPKFNFPLQEEVIDFVKDVLTKETRSKPRVLVVCGSYTIGKEKVFMAAAEVLNSLVWTNPEKRRVMNCLEDSKLQERLTIKATDARVHVLTMQRLAHNQLRSYLNEFRTSFDRLIAFKPTGWTHSPGRTVADIRPSVQGDVHIYSVPYSEHSSFGELEQFVRFLRPKRVIPTVNVGSQSSRNQMDTHIQKWLKMT